MITRIDTTTRERPGSFFAAPGLGNSCATKLIYHKRGLFSLFSVTMIFFFLHRTSHDLYVKYNLTFTRQISSSPAESVSDFSTGVQVSSFFADRTTHCVTRSIIPPESDIFVDNVSIGGNTFVRNKTGEKLEKNKKKHQSSIGFS